MKLTLEIKNEIDKAPLGKLASLFRFFPSDITTGETGKYIEKTIKEKVQDEKHKHDGRYLK